MTEIPLIGKHGEGKVALIDDEDFDRVKNYRWRLWKTCNVYRSQAYIEGKLIPLHQFILGQKWVDHKNGNTLDHQRENLRSCTRSQNGANSKKRTYFKNRPMSSQYKGVHWHYKKWEAQICVSGNYIYLGRFISEHDAAQAYNEAAQKYFGEFAKLNQLGG